MVFLIGSQKRPDKHGGRKLTKSEFDLIKNYLSPLAPSGAPAFGLQNDAAVFSPDDGKELVFTKDTLVSGVHFFADGPPELIAKKAVRVNLSDLASMGAEPTGYLLSLALPKDNFDFENWVSSFTTGLCEDQKEFGWSLWGGDTVSTSGPIVISVTAIGQIDKGLVVGRNNAKVGDAIYVSGDLGDAAAYLQLTNDKSRANDLDYFKNRYWMPSPRLALGRELSSLVSSMMDLSDGLMGDLSHICAHSNVGAVITEAKIPISACFGNLLETKKDYSHLKWCGGDDYELLFTLPEYHEEKISTLESKLGVKLTKIGEVTSGCEAVLLDDEGIRVIPERVGFRHF